MRPETAGATVKGRPNRAVLQLELCIGEIGLAGEDLSTEYLGGILNSAVLLLRDHRVGAKCLVAIYLSERSGLLHANFLKVRLGGAQGVLEGTGIDLKKKIAGFHVLTLLEVDLHEDASDERLDVDRSHGLHGSDREEVERHVFFLRGFYHNGHWAGCAAFLATLAATGTGTGTGLGLLAAAGECEESGEQEGPNEAQIGNHAAAGVRG